MNCSLPVHKLLFTNSLAQTFRLNTNCERTIQRAESVNRASASERNDSTHKGVNKRSQYVIQVQQQRTSTLGLVLFQISERNVQHFRVYASCHFQETLSRLDYCRKGELGSNRPRSEVVGVNVCGWQDVQVQLLTNYNPPKFDCTKSADALFTE